ncbi:MAG: DUF2508 family protein [Clostridia bacterium]|jgi:type II secretory pathway component GspD/PulD (secretin)|nr:DUF2508 family protein [Clostridia bacterium]
MEFEKEQLIFDLNDNEKNIQLISNIIETTKELNKAHNNFEFAEDELVDFYTYQIKALQSKLNYLTRVAKIKNIEFNKAV